MTSANDSTSSTRCRLGAAMLAVAALAACGGGGGDGGTAPFPPPPPPPSSGFQPSSTYAAQCVSPRPASAIDPFTNRQYGDRAGSAATEKNWVRSWVDETYLWYDEVPNAAATNYAGAVDYFDVLKTPKTTASGKLKDQFHFTYDTDEWVDFALSGVELGYGMQFAAISSSPPRRYVVAFTDPGTPAASSTIARGAELKKVDGVDFVNGADVDTLNAALFPTAVGSHTFVFRELGAATDRTVVMTPQAITSTPVQNVKVIPSSTGAVGYMLFNDHIATSEAQLIAAINALKAQGPVTDLVLDIRYNGGGYLDIASELAFMIAGDAHTGGKTFEKVDFNRKNPFGFSEAERTTPFHSTAQGFSASTGSALPTLGLGRVYVLTGAGTCSASEAIINGLRGADVDVVQIGATTCGKPYGFYATENCGTTYFAIQFQGVNAKGFGDYADGFVPGGSAANGVHGCVADDDFEHALGDPAEGRLATALNFRATGICATTMARSGAKSFSARQQEPTLVRSILRENRYYRSR